MSNGDASSIRFCYIDIEGVSHQVTATAGDTLMSVAKNHLIRGIDGDCGGSCACGTCHVVLTQALQQRLPPHDEAEADLLAFIGYSPAQGHRLGCQITVTPDLEGSVITVGTID